MAKKQKKKKKHFSCIVGARGTTKIYMGQNDWLAEYIRVQWPNAASYYVDQLFALSKCRYFVIITTIVIIMIFIIRGIYYGQAKDTFSLCNELMFSANI